MNEVQQLLADAKALISAPERWTQGEFARDSHGHRAYWGGELAKCYCSIGAINAVTHENAVLTMNKPYMILGSQVGGSIVVWNDAPERTHAEVMAAFDKAIEIAGNG